MGCRRPPKPSAPLSAEAKVRIFFRSYSLLLGSECSADAEQKATAEKLYFIGPGFISLVSNARFVGQVDHIGIEGDVLHNLVANRKIDALGCVPENILRGVDGYVVQPIRSVLISHPGGEAKFHIKRPQRSEERRGGKEG